MSLDATQLQGLLYLSLGVGGFSTLLLGFRVLAQNSATDAAPTGKNDEAWRTKEPLRIVEIIEETHDIKTFRMQRNERKPFPSYHSGQFITFQIGSQEKVLRSYSISNASTQRHTLQVSIKRLKDGVGSGWFHSLKVGDTVIGYPPSGLFTDETSTAQQRVYIAGGIGITPMLSMISANIDRAENSEMILFYGMRSMKDMAFHDELKILARRAKNFSYFPILSDASGGWTGDTGFINLSFIRSKIQLRPGAKFYFCGPPVLTDKVTDELLTAGVVAEDIHAEVFASPTVFDKDKIPERRAKIEVLGNSLQYACKDTLLEFLENNNVPISYACRVGVCGTCKAKVDGKVHAITDSGLTLAEKRQGMVLTCVCFPEGDLKIAL
jgi:ferredoxin-NADP reductase